MLPSEYERMLKEEIWGCFKHIGIPIETVMSLPIQDRRFFIMKHNYEQEGIRRSSSKQDGVYQNNGNLNAYAEKEQISSKLRGRR